MFLIILRGLTIRDDFSTISVTTFVVLLCIFSLSFFLLYIRLKVLHGCTEVTAKATVGLAR